MAAYNQKGCFCNALLTSCKTNLWASGEKSAQTSCKHKSFHLTLPKFPPPEPYGRKGFTAHHRCRYEPCQQQWRQQQEGESLLGQNKGLMLSALYFHPGANSAGQHIFPAPFSPLPQRDDLWKDTPAMLSKSPHEPFQQISVLFFHSADWLLLSFCPPSLPRNEPSGKQMAVREKAKHNNRHQQIVLLELLHASNPKVDYWLLLQKILNYFV